VQPAQLEPSSWHSKLDPDSVALKPKLAAVEVVLEAGWLVIDVSGGVVSAGGGDVTTQPYSAGVASTLPAASFARTENRWDLTLRPV
jgi:hypothetical protein